MLMFLSYERAMMVAFLNVTFDVFSNHKNCRNAPLIAINYGAIGVCNQFVSKYFFGIG